MSYVTFILEKNTLEQAPQFHHGLCSLFRRRRPYPAVQLWGKLGLELTDGPITIVSLNKDLGGQRCTSPELLQIVHLRIQRRRASRVTILPGLSKTEGLFGCGSFSAKIRKVSGKLGQVCDPTCAPGRSQRSRTVEFTPRDASSDPRKKTRKSFMKLGQN